MFENILPLLAGFLYSSILVSYENLEGVSIFLSDSTLPFVTNTKLFNNITIIFLSQTLDFV